MKKVLFEDATMYYNKWVSGIAAREFNSQRMKFKDLVKQSFDTAQSPNDAKADNVLPYQLANIASTLGDLLNKTVNTISGLEASLQNPVVQKDEKAQKEVKAITQHLEASLTELKKIFALLASDY
jgi:hypothetical protein